MTTLKEPASVERRGRSLFVPKDLDARIVRRAGQNRRSINGEYLFLVLLGLKAGHEARQSLDGYWAGGEPADADDQALEDLPF
jgi:hypothetical protein